MCTHVGMCYTRQHLLCVRSCTLVPMHVSYPPPPLRLSTTRTHVADQYPHSPKNKATPSWKFGTEPQRGADTSEGGKVPGPIYALNDTNNTPSWTFAPQVRGGRGGLGSGKMGGSVGSAAATAICCHHRHRRFYVCLPMVQRPGV